MAATIFFDVPGASKIPAIGLGTWQATNDAELEAALDAALECGYRHIDTAFVYTNEAVIGRVLKKWFTSGKIKREELFITTKLPMMGTNPDRVEKYIKKSLSDLQLDYVDLYLIHFPVCYAADAAGGIDFQHPEPTDHIAVWKKMEEQVDAGRTKAIGLSNFNIKQIEKVLKSARIKPANLQVELHVFLQQKELVNYCKKNKISIVAYSPLGSPGYNKYRADIGQGAKPLPDILSDETIKKIASKHSKTPAQVALRFLVQTGITAIPKSVTASRLKQNIDIFDFTLDNDDMEALRKLDIGERARVCAFEAFAAAKNHPEWPFPL